MKLFDRKVTKEDLKDLKAGDFVTAVFQELDDFCYPTRATYALTGYLEEIQHTELGPSLELTEGKRKQCVRQPSGAPGGWLIEIWRDVDVKPKESE